MTIKRRISKIMAILPDSMYLSIKYFYVFHKILHLKSPKTFSEKLQWLKLHSYKPLYTTLVDKYLVKDHVKKIIGDEYVIPTFGVWNDANEIDINKLPDKFVLKCNHNSHSVFLCKDKATFDFESVKHLLNESLKENYFSFSRELPYKYVKPCIIAEKFMCDENQPDLIDYKFFCFNGEPKFLGVCTNRQKDLTWDIFDMNFNHIDVKYVANNSNAKIEKPINFNLMVEIASKLAKDIPHVRIDLYEINNQIYFGEFTFFSSGGFAPFTPEKYDFELGKYIKVI